MTGEATSVQSIFFNSPADAVAGLTAAVRSGDAGDAVTGSLGRMPEVAKNAVFTEVGTVAAGILDLDVSDIFTQAWEKSSALRAAAEASMADPDTEEILELATHTMTFAHEPSIEVHVADLPVATIEVQVQMEIKVSGALAVVKGGRMTALRAGSGALTGTLTIAGRQVARREVTLELPLTVNLGEGIPLLAGTAAPAA
ncbi:MAG TPA: hypothetical protein VFR35_12800 [Actinoplanes sp.]|nr:hypothetical protein [Actinoplanes sp.]